MIKFNSKNSVNSSIKCTVRLLEDTQLLELEFQGNDKCSFLIDRVCEQLNLIEKDYFGLRYVDNKRQRHWLEPSKSIIKQIRDVEADNILFSFRVKFYPPNPFRLKEDITRYQIYLQLKRDLLHGRLYCNVPEAAFLGACILQAELGDYNPDEHIDNYVNELKILLKQTVQLEEKMMDIHKNELKGKTAAEVETMFLKKACVLDTYGIDPHAVKDQRGNQLYLGINHTGILTFQGSKKINHFSWPQVQKINYEGKMFIIHVILNEDQRIKKKQTIGFKCPKGSSCRHVWKCAMEQMLFFTFPSSSEVPNVVSGGGFFSWGTKFKYSGRVEREILEDTSIIRESPSVTRVGSLRRKASSEPSTPLVVGSNSLPRSLSNSGEEYNTSKDSFSHNENSHTVLETLLEDQESCTPKTKQDAIHEDTKQNHFILENQTTVTDSSSPSFKQGILNHQLSGQKHFENKPLKKNVSSSMSFLRHYILPIILTLFLILMIVIVVFESNFDLLITVRKIPEIAFFKSNYYDPGKEFLMGRFLRSKLF
ncbi:FERM domain-containing protein 3 isoform X2 [Daktulosphaira vitifoliae]|uniref:FERM domain-containing protein 3 isoform X2 n=1 Tax=Daktulosphaira vitifoliae TaxID=58002 RepID=UPI0021A9921D|nr:FERM domain-containing protein 3 isoform X2 [Daktulosphaira vitifoliae]